MTAVAAGGWKEQLRRVAELALLGIVASVACLPVVTIGAVVATLSSAVGYWVANDDLPRWSTMGAELRRRMLPGVAVSLVGALAALLAVREVQWVVAGTVPGGAIGAGALLVAAGVLVAAVLLAVPRLADGSPWRHALAAGWQHLLRAPLAGAAAVGATLVAVVLGVLLPGVAFALPALVVLALHAVGRAA